VEGAGEPTDAAPPARAALVPPEHSSQGRRGSWAISDPTTAATPPDDGGGARPGDLPDFPPEWGTIVIPDDASELNQEAIALRRELRRRSRRDPVPDRVRLGPIGRDTPSLGVPVIIMAVAVITTLLSLFVVTWDRKPNSPLQGPGGTGSTTLTALTDTVLADASGTRVRLGGLLPAVLLLTATATAPPSSRPSPPSRRPP
jgi:hypothetical protein